MDHKYSTDRQISVALMEIVEQLKARNLLSAAYTRSARSLCSWVEKTVNARIAESLGEKQKNACTQARTTEDANHCAGYEVIESSVQD